MNDEKNLLTDSTFVIWYGVNHLSSIVIPVGLTMLISTYLFWVLFILQYLSECNSSIGYCGSFGRGNDVWLGCGFDCRVYMVYKQEADNTWDSIWQAIVNALVIVVFIGTWHLLWLFYISITVLKSFMHCCILQPSVLLDILAGSFSTWQWFNTEFPGILFLRLSFLWILELSLWFVSLEMYDSYWFF